MCSGEYLWNKGPFDVPDESFMAVKLNDRSEFIESVGGKDDDNFSVTRSSFRVDMNNCSKNAVDNIDICMKFKSGDPPEAVSRISEKLTNSINVYCMDND